MKEERFKIVNNVFVCLTVGFAGVLLLIIPSVSFVNLMNGTQSAKTFVFLYGILGIGALTFIRFIFNGNDRPFKINFLDILLFVWAAYVLVNGLSHGIPFSLRILDFTGLVVLYLVLRQINKKYYVFLSLAVMLGGLVQAVYGNLQLWGYYPSHYGLYKMTGSFFNPGPYAGYLAGVFPLALGFYHFKINIFNSEQNEKLNLQIERVKILI